MSPDPLQMRFYVDAHNFYYRVARPYNIKWIDMEKLLVRLARRVAPGGQAEKIFLFTAPVKGAEAHLRQQTYFRALQERSPCIEIINGEFAAVSQRFAFFGDTAAGLPIRGKFAVQGWEEKQTDVNIGCKIVQDAYTDAKAGRFDMCFLASNDGDLLPPLLIKHGLGQAVGLIATRTTRPGEPEIHRAIRELIPRKDRVAVIEKGALADCRLPDRVGKYTKPAGWN